MNRGELKCWTPGAEVVEAGVQIEPVASGVPAARDSFASRAQKLERLACIVGALRTSYELTRALAVVRDKARSGRVLASEVTHCVEVARRLLDATLQLEDLGN
jgi:hypothetical protein